MIAKFTEVLFTIKPKTSQFFEWLFSNQGAPLF